MCRRERGRILQSLEIVLVRAIPYVHLGFEGLSAFLTFFPLSRVSLRMMEPAQRVAVVVPVTAVLGIGEQDVLVVVVADPVSTTIGFGEFLGFAAKSTFRR